MRNSVGLGLGFGDWIWGWREVREEWEFAVGGGCGVLGGKMGLGEGDFGRLFCSQFQKRLPIAFWFKNG